MCGARECRTPSGDTQGGFPKDKGVAPRRQRRGTGQREKPKPQFASLSLSPAHDHSSRHKCVLASCSRPEAASPSSGATCSGGCHPQPRRMTVNAPAVSPVASAIPLGRHASLLVAMTPLDLRPARSACRVPDGSRKALPGVTTYLGNTSCSCSRLRSWAGTRSRAGRFCRGLLQSSSPCEQTRNTIGGGLPPQGLGRPPLPSPRLSGGGRRA